MDKKTSAVFTCCALFIFSCTQEPATIIKHSTSAPGRTGFVSSNPYKTIVAKGDTLYSIARKNNLEVRAVIDSNDMRPPYTLIPGQTIKLPKAAFHIVSDSDNLYAISRSYNVDIGRLAQKNHITPPYNLTKGQKLLLPSSTANDNGTTEIASKIDYDFGTKASYQAPRGVSSSDLAPIGSKDTPSQPQILAGNDDDSSPFATSVVTSKTPENFDQKEAEPFSYKSESEFGNSDSEENTKETSNQDKPAPLALTAKPVNNNPKSPPAVQAHKEETLNEDLETKAQAGKISKAGFMWPVSGKVISRFGPKKGGLYNDGINIAAKPGSAIKAAGDGEVVYSGNELRGYGNMLLIKHNNGYLTAYAHAADITVKKGDIIKSGQIIGHIGQTGHVSSPQLHFSIRQGRKAVDPAKYLS